MLASPGFGPRYSGSVHPRSYDGQADYLQGGMILGFAA